MEITINLEDYVTPEEIKAQALYTLSCHFENQLRCEADIDRVLSNLTSEYIFERVCMNLDISHEEVERRITEGIQKALESDHIKYYVFRRKDAWDRSESPAVTILDNVLKDCRATIEREVEKRIAEYDFRELREEIEDTIYYTICRKLQEPTAEQRKAAEWNEDDTQTDS